MRLLALLPLLFACKREAETCRSAEAWLDDDVRMRVRVQWETSAPGRSWVEYGENLGTPPVEDGSTSHEAVLLGLPPLIDVDWTAYTETDRGTVQCSGTIRTGNAPSGMPEITVNVSDVARQSPERWLVGVLMATRNVMFVIDREGNWVFHHEPGDGALMVDTESPRAGVLAVNMFDAEVTVDEGAIREIALDGSEPVDHRTPLAHHVFAVVPEGYVWLALDVRDWTNPETGETLQVAGDAIMETNTLTGEERTVWSAWDDLEVVERDRWLEDSMYQGYADWTHGNGLSWSPATDTLLYSSAALRRVFEISRFDGRILRSFGDMSDYRTEPEESGFSAQHDPTFTDRGNLLLTTNHLREPATGAREYVIDPVARTLTAVWEYGFDQGLQAHSLGQATRLANGNTIVNFGSVGLIREVTPDGEVVWEAQSEFGAAFGNVRLIDALYQETPPPQ